MQTVRDVTPGPWPGDGRFRSTTRPAVPGREEPRNLDGSGV